MNVLFITTARLDITPYGDGSTRYRCFNVAEELRAQGHCADVAALDTLALQTLGRYDIVSVLRPRHSRRLERLLSLCHARGIRTVADFDDLIFDPALASESPLVVNGFAQTSRVRERFAGHERALRSFDEITVSTQPLVDAALRVHPQAHVTLLRNGLSRYWLAHCEKHSHDQRHSERVTYLPGTRSHDHDFSSVKSALVDYINGAAERELQIVGSLEFDEQAFANGRLLRQSWIDYFSLPGLIARSWVTIAPLVDNQFNRAKSHIKFIESAALGTPIVCSPNVDMLDHQVPGLYVVNKLTEWHDALEALADPEHHRACRQQLRDYTLTSCTTETTTAALIETWSSQTNEHHATHLPLAS